MCLVSLQAQSTLQKIDESITSYINLKVFISIVTAIGSGTVLWTLGVDLWPALTPMAYRAPPCLRHRPLNQTKP